MTMSRRNVLRLSAPALAFVATASHGRTGPPRPSDFEQQYKQFIKQYPDWLLTSRIDSLRSKDYPRLAASKQAYLDYTGASLQSDSQVKRHAQLLNSVLLGNPHSINTPSENAAKLISECRTAILKYFNASNQEYEVIFTPNATYALRLVGEHYGFGPGKQLLLTNDNHNSVNGISVFAKKAGSNVKRLPLTKSELRLDLSAANAALASLASSNHNKPGLFAFPAQSNFSGVLHPLELIKKAQEHGWDVLLDTAAFTPTNALDLNRFKPEFACISFYKMFGYPTGIGCLIAKKSSLSSWKQNWFAGGNVKHFVAAADLAVPMEGAAAFEDGTVDFLMIPAVTIGLDHLKSIGITTINKRVGSLTGWTLQQMQSLKHESGAPLVTLLGPTNTKERGGSIAFALKDSRNRMHDFRKVCALAAKQGLSLRSGFFCNPGAGEAAFGVNIEMLKPLLQQSDRFDFFELRQFLRNTQGFDIGAIRASYGIASDFSDAWRLVQFLKQFINTTTTALGTEPDKVVTRDELENGA